MPSINPDKYIIKVGPWRKLLNEDIDYYILSSDSWGFFKSLSFFARKRLINDFAAAVLNSRDFKIIQRFEIIPPLLGIYPQKRFQLSAPFEFITPTFIVLKRKNVER
ncbi:hypothetical protein ES708_20893 [subsurface metagenome]